MKTNTFISICFILLGTLILNAQNNISFTELNQASKNSKTLKNNFTNYKTLKIQDNFSRISSGTVLNISLDKDYTFQLKENKLLSDNYFISIKTENGIEKKSLSEIGFDGKYFTNENLSENNQLILSIFENSYSIYIKDSKSEFYIESLSKYDKTANADEYVFYNAKDAIIPENATCGVETSALKIKEKPTYNTQKVGGCKTVEVVMSVDYSMYNTYGSISATINRTLEVLNLSEANFTIVNGISDDVHFKVTQHFIVSCDTCGYWPTTF